MDAQVSGGWPSLPEKKTTTKNKTKNFSSYSRTDTDCVQSLLIKSTPCISHVLLPFSLPQPQQEKKSDWKNFGRVRGYKATCTIQSRAQSGTFRSGTFRIASSSWHKPDVSMIPFHSKAIRKQLYYLTGKNRERIIRSFDLMTRSHSFKSGDS